MEKIFVIKNKGEREPFSWRKIYLSAQRVGASKHLARKISTQIKNEVYDNITTKEIFGRIQQVLLQEEKGIGIRFNLKEAIRRLGPSGFPFEKYVGAIFEAQGFTVQLNQMIPGRCVTHEIDFLAKKGKQVLIAECKFHQMAGSRVDLKVALSTYACFLDLKSGNFFQKAGLKNLELKPFIITNAKFTSQVVQYANCMGISLLGWRHPDNQGLEYMIESQKLYPITILPSLRDHLLETFAKEKMMLAKNLLATELSKFARRLDIPEQKLKILRDEADLLLQE